MSKENIWFDFANSPQVKFYAKIIRELSHNYNIIITCRPLANTIELLELENFKYSIVGKHYGTNKITKSLGVIRRVILLWLFIRKKDISLAASHSSFYLPIVSRLLNIKSLYINDNEHASWNKIAIKYATKAMFPEPLQEIAKIKKWDLAGNISYYPGIKEGVYLWDYSKIEGSFANKNKSIYFRTEPWNADYYKGKLNFLDETLIELAKSFNVKILPRGDRAKKHYQNPRFHDLIVIDKSIPQYEIFNDCLLFIGAGGSMTREAAVVGIPTLSIYQSELLSVDKYLVNKKIMKYDANPTLKGIKSIISDSINRSPDEIILNYGKEAQDLIIKTLTNL